MERTWYWYCSSCKADGEVKAEKDHSPDGNQKECRKFFKQVGTVHNEHSPECKVRGDELTVGPTPFVLTRVVNATMTALAKRGRCKIAVRDEGDAELGRALVKCDGGEKALKRIMFIVVAESEREKHPIGSFLK